MRMCRATAGASTRRRTSTALRSTACGSLHAYANSAVCSATRTALITGRYQYRYPIGLEEPLEHARRRLAARRADAAVAAKKAGYSTALIGKWHLGTAAEIRPAEERL